MGIRVKNNGRAKPRNIPNLVEESEISSADFLLKYLARKIAITTLANSEG
jgi:hypothetical protein